jgi:hypothetical protein
MTTKTTMDSPTAAARAGSSPNVDAKGSQMDQDEPKTPKKPTKPKKARAPTRVEKWGKRDAKPAGWDEIETHARDAYARGDLVVFVETTARLYALNRRLCVGDLLADLFLQHIGLGSATIAFAIFEAVHCDNVNADALLIARIATARRRLNRPLSNFVEAKTTTTLSTTTADDDTDICVARALPVQWLVPIELGLDERTSGSDHCWAVLWSGVLVRCAATPLSMLLQLAQWTERVRPHVNTTMFLQRIDATCDVGFNSWLSCFDANLDPNSRHGQTMRMFLQTMRVWLVNDIGDRSLVLFWMFVSVRTTLSVADKPCTFTANLAEQLTDLDTELDSVRNLADAVLPLLVAAPSTKHTHTPVKTTSVTTAMALPRLHQTITASKIVATLSKQPSKQPGLVLNGGERLVDWSKADGAAWIRKVNAAWQKQRLSVPPTAINSARSKRHRQDPNITRHLEALDQYALEMLEVHLAVARNEPRVSGFDVVSHLLTILQWGRCVARLPENRPRSWITGTPAGTAILPQTRETGAPRRVGHGEAWVGPFDLANDRERQEVARVMFRTAKLTSWGIFAPPVELVLDADKTEGSAKKELAWLFFRTRIRYDALVGCQDHRMEFTYPNPTRVEVDEYGTTLNRCTEAVKSIGANKLVMTSSAPLTTFSTVEKMQLILVPPVAAQTDLAPVSIAASFIKLAIARALLGIETGQSFKDQDTLLQMPARAAQHLWPTVIPVGMFTTRSAESYRASQSAVLAKSTSSSRPISLRQLIRQRGRYRLEITSSGQTHTNDGASAATAATAAAATAATAAAATAATAAAATAATAAAAASASTTESAASDPANVARMTAIQAADADFLLFGGTPHSSSILSDLRNRVFADKRLLSELRPLLADMWKCVKSDPKMKLSHVVIGRLRTTFPHLVPDSVLSDDS